MTSKKRKSPSRETKRKDKVLHIPKYALLEFEFKDFISDSPKQRLWLAVPHKEFKNIDLDKLLSPDAPSEESPEYVEYLQNRVQFWRILKRPSTLTLADHQHGFFGRRFPLLLLRHDYCHVRSADVWRKIQRISDKKIDDESDDSEKSEAASADEAEKSQDAPVDEAEVSEDARE